MKTLKTFLLTILTSIFRKVNSKIEIYLYSVFNTRPLKWTSKINCCLGLFILIFTNQLYSQETKRVLFIGNSYTSTNNLPQMISDIALSAGDTLIFDSNTPGGYSLGQHSDDTITRNKIQNPLGWDFVVFQQQSQILALIDEGMEGTINWYGNIMAGFGNLDSLTLNNPCYHSMIFMTWGRENGDSQNCPNNPPSCTYASMDSMIYLKTFEWANAYLGYEKPMISPVGRVWREIRNQYPAINLYQTDGSHPSMEGSYAAACTFYSSIFRKNPLSITNNLSINAATASIIRNVVKDIVYDNLPQWYITFFDVSCNDFGYYFFNPNDSATVKFYSTGFLWNGMFGSRYWDFDDGNTSTLADPEHTFSSPGIYDVKLIVTDCFNADTVVKTIVIGQSTGIDQIVADGTSIKVYPNPANDKITITVKNNLIGKVTMYNSVGAMVYSSVSNEKNKLIDLSHLTGGIYLIALPDLNKTFRIIIKH
jgi:hypothetical protein